MDAEARWTGAALLKLLHQAHRVRGYVIVRIDFAGDQWVVEMSDTGWDRIEPVAEDALLAAVKRASETLGGLRHDHPSGIPSDDQAALVGAEMLTLSGDMLARGGGFSLGASFPSAGKPSFSVHAYYEREPKLRHRNAYADTLMGAFSAIRVKLAEQDVIVAPVVP